MSTDAPIPGRHNDRGADPKRPYTRTVEAPNLDEAPEVKKSDDAAQASHVLQTMEHPETGTYRVRAWTPEQDVAPAAQGYTETGRRDAPEGLGEAHDEQTSARRYVVLENTETGDVHVDQQANLSNSWFEEGRFDQVTFFETEDEAAAYTDQQQSE